MQGFENMEATDIKSTAKTVFVTPVERAKIYRVCAIYRSWGKKLDEALSVLSVLHAEKAKATGSVLHDDLAKACESARQALLHEESAPAALHSAFRGGSVEESAVLRLAVDADHETSAKALLAAADLVS